MAEEAKKAMVPVPKPAEYKPVKFGDFEGAEMAKVKAGLKVTIPQTTLDSKYESLGLTKEVIKTVVNATDKVARDALSAARDLSSKHNATPVEVVVGSNRSPFSIGIELKPKKESMITDKETGEKKVGSTEMGYVEASLNYPFGKGWKKNGEVLQQEASYWEEYFSKAK